MKYWVAIFVLLLASCSEVPTQHAFATATVVLALPTPQIIQVTRIVMIEQTVVVTETPVPSLAQDCFNKAMTQHEINDCAGLELELANTELMRIISLIEFSPEDKETFNKLQDVWRQQVEADCEFFYGQLVNDGDGHLYYKGGSMAPMRISLCISSRIQQRIDELKLAYLTPDG